MFSPLPSFMNRCALWLTVLVVALTACAPQSASPSRRGPAGSTSSAEELSRSDPKRITAAVNAEPPSLYYALIPSPIRANPGSIQELVNPGLAAFDNTGTLRPMAAEAVPSVENGLWKLLPDGRMETTWRIRDGVRWHDGAPMTSDDLGFTLGIVADREMSLFRHKYIDVVEGWELRDPRTVTVHWKQPLVQADWLFTYVIALPMPKHLLEHAYQENRVGFADLPFWSQDFVGHGPFRLKEWARGSHLTLVGNEAYVLGRPRLDEIEVRFILDGNTLISNVLAGAIDLVMRQGISTDQGLQVRDQWRDGRVLIASDGWVVSYPQFVNANPPIVTNLQFRRAMLHGVDRQSLADTLMAGLAPVADSILNPATTEGRAVASQVVRYPYDPARSATLFEELGYRKGADGIYRDSSGQLLAMEVRTTAQRDIHAKTMLPVADQWQRLGLKIDTVVWPAQAATDLELQWTFPSFVFLRQPAGLDRMVMIHTNEAPLPERNFLGGNNGRYMNRDLDALIDRYLVTVPEAQRMDIAGQIIRHQTENAVMLGMFFDTTPSLVANRLTGLTELNGSDRARQSFNAHEWTVR